MGKCFKCHKFGHFARECPQYGRIRQRNHVRRYDDANTEAEEQEEESDAEDIDILLNYYFRGHEEKEEDNTTTTEENVTAEPKGVVKLAMDLKQLFLDERMTDAILKVDNREFNVHKAILVSRSPVFASMFEYDMAEKASNVVDIPDCTSESFEVFLHYLYTGTADTLSTSNVYNLYYAADKYRIDDLKEECVQFMMDNITEETFCDIISLSLRHEETTLKVAATDFFSKNIKKIIKTVQWQNFLHDNTTHANELLIKALNA